MEAKDKRILIYAISLVLVIAVIINGSRITKIDIPGLFGIEFSSNQNESDRQSSESVTSRNETNALLNESAARNNESDLQQSSAPAQNQTTEQQVIPQIMNRTLQTDSSDENEIESFTPSITYNLTGSWIGSDGSEYIIEQTGNNISFIEYGLWGITASGSGILDGNELVIDYETTFGTIGSAVLNLTENGRELSGIANDLTSGASTNLRLYKE
jgi:hypothetical protein